MTSGFEAKTNIPLVSVIVPVKNSDRTLEHCLESIKAQTYCNIELIVVDNGSSDRSIAISHAVSDKVIVSSGLRTTVRNSGANLAKGEFLLFIDSDMILPRNAIEECVELTTRGYDGCILPEINLVQGYWMRAYSFTKNYYPSWGGGIRFLTKDKFMQVGGYDERMEAGEDFDLHFRVLDTGANIGRIDSVTLHNIAHLRIIDTFRKNMYYSKTLNLFFIKHADRQREHRGSKVSQLRHMRRAIIKHPLEFTGWIIVQIIRKAQIDFTVRFQPLVLRLGRR